MSSLNVCTCVHVASYCQNKYLIVLAPCAVHACISTISYRDSMYTSEKLNYVHVYLCPHIVHVNVLHGPNIGLIAHPYQCNAPHVLIHTQHFTNLVLVQLKPAVTHICTQTLFWGWKETFPPGARHLCTYMWVTCWLD